EAGGGVGRAGGAAPRPGQRAGPGPPAPPPARLPPPREPGGWPDEPVGPPEGLLFFNGLGCFTPDGREYCVLIQGPAPPKVGLNGPPGHTAPPIAAPMPPRLPPAPWRT